MPESPATGRPTSRPLSPHVQIYRWPITMGTSILHRVTGVGLSLGTFLLTWWLVAASMGPEEYIVFQSAAFSWVGRFVLFGFTLALVFHALNGVRHLFWDAGYGYKLATAHKTGIAVYCLTFLVTLLVWVVAYRSMGGWQ